MTYLRECDKNMENIIKKNMPGNAEQAPENSYDFIKKYFSNYENFQNHVIAKAKEAENYYIKPNSEEFIKFIFEDCSDFDKISSATRKALKATARGIAKGPKEEIKDERLKILKEAEWERKIDDAYGYEKRLGGNKD